jgi:hypothetical protein
MHRVVTLQMRNVSMDLASVAVIVNNRTTTVPKSTGASFAYTQRIDSHHSMISLAPVVVMIIMMMMMMMMMLTMTMISYLIRPVQFAIMRSSVLLSSPPSFSFVNSNCSELYKLFYKLLENVQIA